VEVDEGTLLQDPMAVAGILERLRKGGIEAALDDFGTGYSSLAFVHRFPLRMIKVDRSFIAGFGSEDPERSRAVLAAFIALARSLQLEVLAEGIETAAQRDALLAMGCHYGQGFLFGRAQPLSWA
jgi:FOG: EAL domain